MTPKVLTQLDSLERRALHLMVEEPAHELSDTPLKTVGRLKDLGLAEVTARYRKFHGGKYWQCQTVSLTAEGQQLATLDPNPPRCSPYSRQKVIATG